MNVNFEMALRLINLGAYDKAERELRTAIAKETEKGKLSTAAEYRCVLGELLVNIGRKRDANKELKQVVEYCKETGNLSKQREIAEELLKPRK